MRDKIPRLEICIVYAYFFKHVSLTMIITVMLIKRKSEDLVMMQMSASKSARTHDKIDNLEGCQVRAYKMAKSQ